MKKRIAFLLIVPLLCVLAASLNISYMPAGGFAFIRAEILFYYYFPKKKYSEGRQ